MHFVKFSLTEIYMRQIHNWVFASNSQIGAVGVKSRTLNSIKRNLILKVTKIQNKWSA